MEKKKDSQEIIYRKLFTKFVSYILVLSLIVSVFSINIYAEEPKDDTYLDTYAAHYFNHLTSNFGNNEENTCGYVAAGMLLSFYDSYLNDNFIMNDCNCESDCDYDVLGSITSSTNSVSSPGIKREDDWEELTGYTDYNAFIDANANEYFHLRLLKIGRDELGLYTPPTQNQRSSDSTTKPEDSPWGITISEVRNVIQAWINKGEQIIKNNVTIHFSSYNDFGHLFLEDPNAAIRDEMIEKVEAGIPVIYFGYDKVGKGGHFMIAHDYDEATDTLYFHTGWLDHIMNDKDTENFVYTANTSILWFEIGDGLATSEHSCIYNYASSTSSTTGTLCGCQIYSGSSNHNHNYSITDYNPNCHFCRCVCGKITTNESHSLIYTQSNATQHWERCEINGCGYGCGVNHNYTIFSSHTGTEHTLQCACGETTTKSHYAIRYVSRNKDGHYVYCKCGYLIAEETHNMISMNIRYSACRDCGYMKDNSISGEVIKGVEPETPTA